MEEITVAINTRNEEGFIKECIESARLLTPHVTVLDMKSRDKTADIAQGMGAKVYVIPIYAYVEPARQIALEKTATPWVLIMDPDERITPELAEEIKKAIQSETHTYYRIPRKNMFGGGKWLKHGGWWPDYQVRLIKKASFKEWPSPIHSSPKIEGTMGTLSNPLIHYQHGDIEKMVEKTVVFENIEADLLYNAGRPVSTLTFARKFLGELYRRLVRGAGFLDGTVGIIESIYQAFSKTITYLMLYEKKKGRAL